MAANKDTITITSAEYRPCFAEGKKALFHKWIEESEIVAPSVMVGGHNGGVIKAAFAIVEYEDGTIAKVEPHKIKFADGKFYDYEFE